MVGDTKMTDDILERLERLAQKQDRSELGRLGGKAGGAARARRFKELSEQPAPETRECKKCRVTKPFGEFMAAKNCLWGRSHTCKSCYRKRGQEWKAKNPGWEKAYLREYRKKNRARERATQERWRNKNPEHTARLQRERSERFRSDPARWSRHREFCRRMMANRRAGGGPEALLVGLVDRATAKVPDAICEMVRQDLFLRVQLHEVSRLDLLAGSEVVQQSIRTAWKDMPDRFATASLDAPLTDDGLTLADVLTDESA